jgi:hypothetical protein
MREFVLGKLADKVSDDEANRIAFFAMVAADRQEAFRWLRSLSDKLRLRSLELYAALLADELHLDQERDQLFKTTYQNIAPEKQPACRETSRPTNDSL